MAPLFRGARSRSQSHSRGRGKIAGVRNGQGQGRSFKTRRVEEPAALAEEVTVPDVEQDAAVSEADTSSDEDEGDQGVSVPNSYNALLQSLTSGPVHERSRKKRKVSHDYESTNSATIGSADRDDGFDKGADELEVDEVDEPEERGNVPLEEIEEVEENGLDPAEDNAPEDSRDPYQWHFANRAEDELEESIKEVTGSPRPTETFVLPDGWKGVGSLPPPIASLISIKRGSKSQVLQQDVWLKRRLRERAAAQVQKVIGTPASVSNVLLSYSDVLFCDSGTGNAQGFRRMACLHALNHILKTRDKIIKNSYRLSSADPSEDLEYRDQGFTRPKVLMLLPTRQTCVKAVEAMLSFYDTEQQENKKRFQDSYSQNDPSPLVDKPKDYQELFEGNDSDLFRLGIKFTRKTVKFFSQFYNSDIIFASPLGLRMAIGQEDSRKPDHDFLSSIEIVVIDRADALLMQNWEHVEYIFEHLNLQPKEAHGCDFSRVRNWYLDGNAKYLRQSVLLTAFNTPEINKLYSRYCFNVDGSIKVAQENFEGAITELGIPLKQTFSRYDSLDPSSDPDMRFKYFTNSILPSITKVASYSSRQAHGILIFISSYMDFVRVRNFLANSITAQNVSFGSISEYTAVPDISRARSHFLSGRHAILLYTGRAHHFQRYRVRGVKRVIMYGLPDNPVFYREIAGDYLARSISEGTLGSTQANVRSIFSKWDVLKLERIVGTKRYRKMIKDSGDTFDFV